MKTVSERIAFSVGSKLQFCDTPLKNGRLQFLWGNLSEREVPPKKVHGIAHPIVQSNIFFMERCFETSVLMSKGKKRDWPTLSRIRLLTPQFLPLEMKNSDFGGSFRFFALQVNCRWNGCGFHFGSVVLWFSNKIKLYLIDWNKWCSKY